MDEIIKESKDFLKENYNNLSEVIKERVFSPMYFYFIIAWIITNWQFVYAFFFLDPKFVFESQKTDKISLLESFYSMDLWLPAICSVAKLVVIPAISAFIIVWWFSKLSEAFYEKSEQHKINKRFILNKLLYTEKVSYSQEQRKIRDAESDKNEISYIDNKDFNNWYDEGKDNVKIGEYEFLPSESLYNNDFQAYKQELEIYKEEKKNHKYEKEDIFLNKDYYNEIYEKINSIESSDIDDVKKVINLYSTSIDYNPTPFDLSKITSSIYSKYTGKDIRELRDQLKKGESIFSKLSTSQKENIASFVKELIFEGKDNAKKSISMTMQDWKNLIYEKLRKS